MSSQITRVISSPSSSTTGFATLILAMKHILEGGEGASINDCSQDRQRTMLPRMQLPLTAPAIILSEPQLGENIGACARAMANFGLVDLRLVRPRDGWPNPKAEAMAAQAVSVIQAARIYDSVESAVGDLKVVFATTARDRSMAKSVLTPAEAALRLRGAEGDGMASGVLFGNERAGLTNDEVALADCAITIPTAPGFSSLNLGQAVLLTAYEWFKAGDATAPVQIEHGAGQPAPREELIM